MAGLFTINSQPVSDLTEQERRKLPIGGSVEFRVGRYSLQLKVESFAPYIDHSLDNEKLADFFRDFETLLNNYGIFFMNPILPNGQKTEKR